MIKPGFKADYTLRELRERVCVYTRQTMEAEAELVWTTSKAIWKVRVLQQKWRLILELRVRKNKLEWIEGYSPSWNAKSPKSAGERTEQMRLWISRKRERKQRRNQEVIGSQVLYSKNDLAKWRSLDQNKKYQEPHLEHSNCKKKKKNHQSQRKRWLAMEQGRPRLGRSRRESLMLPVSPSVIINKSHHH